jgi:hypothetical protein
VSSSGTFPAEGLYARWVLSLADARQTMGDWRRDDNEIRLAQLFPRSSRPLRGHVWTRVALIEQSMRR